MPSTFDVVAAAEATAERTAAANDGLDAPPARALALLTCMDARVLPHDLLVLAHGDAHVVRNAGGRASDDAVRSLAVSTRLLGVRHVVVLHHSRCGNAGTSAELTAALADAGLATPPEPLLAGGATPQAVRADVERLVASGMLAPGTTVEGALVDVDTGLVTRLVEPTTTS